MKQITITLLCGLLLCSCYSSKKIKSSHSATTDSSNVSDTHKKGISITDSSGITGIDSSYSSGITVEVDTTRQGLFATGEDPEQKAIDLAGPQVNKKPVHQVTINGNTITSSQPIKSVTVTDNGHVKKYDAVDLHKKDSGEMASKTDVQVHKEESTKEKQVDRSGANPLIWIGLGIGVLAFIWLVWDFGLFKKRNGTTDKFDHI